MSLQDYVTVLFIGIIATAIIAEISVYGVPLYCLAAVPLGRTGAI